ncbi:hypothetical protein Hanom_Chr06g00548661 [Helianthus anomalus]
MTLILFFLFFSCNEAKIQAEDVFIQRIETLALNLDKVRYVMTNVFGDPKPAPPL